MALVQRCSGFVLLLFVKELVRPQNMLLSPAHNNSFPFQRVTRERQCGVTDDLSPLMAKGLESR